MAVEWALLRSLVTTASTLRRLLADESSQRMVEILGAVSDVHQETAQRQWLGALKLQGPERASMLEAVAGNLELAYTARTKALENYRTWEWSPEIWQNKNTWQRFRQKFPEFLPGRYRSARRLETFRDSAELACQFALLNAMIYRTLGNRETIVHDRVDDALLRFRQYMAIQNERYSILGDTYQNGMTDPVPDDTSAQFDYRLAIEALKDARTLYKETTAALDAFEGIIQSLTGAPAGIAPLRTKEYPKLAAEIK
ncbi:hypothetical protein [Streptomyces meridianus]|uniref:Uncharacterized protein n=1 Tax=Streptomyces meridianus TaxID=2938945 RepID=A0ABT0XDB0_9ACTN|nr:hypothetical protein [Streptomyces meridianus]MCM2580409.1 hypothetical protein [Streptomyces meridianus]